jgi:hypothetical protein
MGDALLPFPLTARSVHLCVDTQRIFSAVGPWPAPGWKESCRSSPPWRAVIPSKPSSAGSSRLSARTRCLVCGNTPTRECLDLDLLELMLPLAALCPPATVVDKTRYSGFAEPKLLAHLREREADALIISGSETDVWCWRPASNELKGDVKFVYAHEGLECVIRFGTEDLPAHPRETATKVS